MTPGIVPSEITLSIRGIMPTPNIGGSNSLRDLISWGTVMGCMDVRDAVEADAERLADLTDSPTEAMRNLIHDRTVRVATDGEETVGFVSFDAQDDTVHVTQIDGPRKCCDRLLDEPIRFAECEAMSVEALVPENESDVMEAIEEKKFRREGTGPRFDGTPTVRYRFDP